MNLDINKISLQELKNVFDMIVETLNKNSSLFYLLKDRLFKLDDSNTELSEKIKKLEDGMKNGYVFQKGEIDSLEKRIERLESIKLGEELDPKVWVYVNERLDKLESAQNRLSAEAFVILKEKIDELFEKIKIVEKGLKNYREYRSDIEDLETDVMYLTRRVKKIEGLIGNAVKEKVYGNKA